MDCGNRAGQHDHRKCKYLDMCCRVVKRDEGGEARLPASIMLCSYTPVSCSICV